MTSITLKKVFASLPHAERGRPIRIAGDPKNGKNFLYCNGNSVFIRNLKDPVQVDIYTEHSKPTTIARYAPSGFYIASGDASGKIRIWDTINPEHILKYEYTVLGGALCDLSWSPDSQRISVCGNGREKFAHVISWDTGTSVGEIVGHTKSINTVSYRPKRPFRIVTASEDQMAGSYAGPPFKLQAMKSLHTNFVNVARYDSEGDVILSGGADGKLVKYDGDKLQESVDFLKDTPAHKGGIYELCFSPDNKEVLTASGDKTAKIFDVQTGETLCIFQVSTGPSLPWQDMQLGCLWQGDEIITVNAAGHIIYHDRNNQTQPKRVIKGHMKPIMAMAISEDKTTAFTGGLEGIIYWDVESGDCEAVSGKGHTNSVVDMVISGDNLFSVGIDDTLRVTSVSNKMFSPSAEKLDSQPKQVDSRRGVTAVACVNHVMVFEGGAGEQQQTKMGGGLKKLGVVPQKAEPASVSVHPDGVAIAVGFKDEAVIKIYSLQSGQLSEKTTIEVEGEVSCLAYSPDGTVLAYGASKTTGVISTDSYKVENSKEMHTARVICLEWSPDSAKFATGALDGLLKVWKANMPRDVPASIKAYTMSHMNKLHWLDSSTIITAGHDSNVKQFTVSN